MKQILVECTLKVLVEVDETRGIEQIEFEIEENGCPGTGVVGRAIMEQIERDEEKQVCWGCNMRGKNKILKGLD